MIKRILALALLISSLLAADPISFRDLTALVAGDLKRNIYLDKDIKNYELDLNIPDHSKRGELYELYKIVLFEHDLKLQFNKRGKFYFVTSLTIKELEKSDKYSDKVVHYYHYKIRNITNEDVVNVMKIFPTVKFTYLKQSDIIAYSATDPVHREVLALLKRADNKVKSKMIRITIFTVNKDRAKEYGSKISKIGIGFNYNVKNLFSSLISSASRVFNLTDISSFAFMLYAMEHYGVADIQQSPTLLVTNGKKTTVNSVLNVPYKESTTTTQEARTVTRDQIKYRDIGLIVNVDPKIKGNSVFLDLDLVSEELLSEKDNKPITQKITYHNFVTVKRGKPILLTGIKKVSKTYERAGVPILSSIPIIGELFKYQTKKHSELNINIMIELVEPGKKLYTRDDFIGKFTEKVSSPVAAVQHDNHHPDPMKILNSH